MRLDIIKAIYLPTNAQVNCLKKRYQNLHSNSSDMFRCSHTIFRELIIHTC